MCGFENVVPGIDLLKVPFFDGSYRTGVVCVRNGAETAIIDSAETAETAENCILPAMTELGLRGKHFCLLCTHTHGDHIGGHEYLRAHADCTAAATHAAAADLPGGAPEHLLSEGEYPIRGLRLLATPGHANDAVCYLHESTGTLITGDSFQGAGTDGVGLALIGDVDAYRASVTKMMNLGAERMVAGHGFAPCDFVIEGSKRVHAFLQCCLDTVSRYERFISQKCEQFKGTRAFADALIEEEHREISKYICRSDGTIEAVLRGLNRRV